MGTDKLNLPTPHGPLGSLALRKLLHSGLDHTFLVTGRDHLPIWLPDLGFEQNRSSKWSHIYCQDADEGQSHSIRQGISAAMEYDADAAVIVLADQPLIQSNAIDELICHFLSDDSRIVVTTCGEIIGPPVLFPKAAFDELLQLRGDKGAKSLLRQESRIRRIPNACPVSMFDIDDEHDYLTLLRFFQE